MDNIVSCIQSAAVVLVVVTVYVYLVSSVYPWLTMHLVWMPKRGFPGWGDRGVARVRFPEGRGVVYEPDPRVRRYVPRYALFTQNGNKYIRLRVNRRTAYIRYDVAVFDSRGRLLDLLEVSERIASEGVTRAVRLPASTAYACVIPRRVDGVYTCREWIVGYSLTGTGILAGLTVLTTVAVGYMLHDELTYLMSTLTNQVPVTPGRTLAVSALLGILCAGWVVLMHGIHTVRRINR